MQAVLNDLNNIIVEWSVIKNAKPGDKLWMQAGNLELDEPTSGLLSFIYNPMRSVHRRWTGNSRETTLTRLWQMVNGTRTNLHRVLQLMNDVGDVELSETKHLLQFISHDWHNVAVGLNNLRSTYGNCKCAEEIKIIVDIHLKTIEDEIKAAKEAAEAAINRRKLAREHEFRPKTERQAQGNHRGPANQ